MITQEQKDILNRYAEIKRDIKALEVMADEINPKVLEVMEFAKVEEIEIGDIGKLSLGARRNYDYGPEVKKKEEELKAEKKEMEQRGTALYKEKKYVIFKGLKDNSFDE